MIRLVTLKGFKRFTDTEFRSGARGFGRAEQYRQDYAIAGDCGRNWLSKVAGINDFNPRRNGYQWQDLERLAFSAVAVRSFEMLWRNRQRAHRSRSAFRLVAYP